MLVDDLASGNKKSCRKLFLPTIFLENDSDWIHVFTSFLMMTIILWVVLIMGKLKVALTNLGLVWIQLPHEPYTPLAQT